MGGALDREQTHTGPAYAGRLESHLTVEAPDREALGRFQAACAALGVKCVHIELPRGASRSQPMANLVHEGTLADARHQATDLAGDLQRAGFAVVRVKIEASLENADVPHDDNEASLRPAENYFEYHVKLRLPDGYAAGPVLAACVPHGAHLSSNAFKNLGGGLVERFVTLRCYGAGRNTADARLDALLASLEAAGHAPAKVVREYCVLDSNLALDDGWLGP
jgi:hypothetical protein